MNKVSLYTDGGCSKKGPGGWAYILRHVTSGNEIEVFGNDTKTTNNKMEMTAVIRGLEKLKEPCEVDLYTDSEYVGKGLTEWMPNWKRNDWMRKERGGTLAPVKNVELWKQLDELNSIHKINYKPVRGHSGHPENERCDELAVEAYQNLM